MQASDLFGDNKLASKRVLLSALLDSFDRFPDCRLPRSLFASLVTVLFGAVPGDVLSLSQFDTVFRIVKSKLSHGEPALGRLVGKENVNISDEWIFALKAEYVAPPVYQTRRTCLFRKGDACDSCFVVVKGSIVCSGETDDETRWMFGENDVIGLEDMLLKQKTRSFSAWIESCGGADPLLTQPLFLRIESTSFTSLEPRDFLHFLSGALCARTSSDRFVSFQNNKQQQMRRPKAVDALPSHFVSQATVLIEKGEEVTSVFYICEGQMQDSHFRTFQSGSLLCLPEFLSSEGKIAKTRITAITPCVREQKKKKIF
jgi:CRP-like cAMP-binding protein